MRADIAYEHIAHNEFHNNYQTVLVSADVEHIMLIPNRIYVSENLVLSPQMNAKTLPHLGVILCKYFVNRHLFCAIVYFHRNLSHVCKSSNCFSKLSFSLLTLMHRADMSSYSSLDRFLKRLMFSVRDV